MSWTGDSVRAESVHIKTDTEGQQVSVELKGAHLTVVEIDAGKNIEERGTGETFSIDIN